ncbi:hypothetical protein AB0M28_26310 [Streptomyces sp. NPDC051940]|uniref:hypothetical protein n=1 Tax=Streptomyces sp. NPDC051940 TaxID=3155675 RepID=UPI003449AEC8
MLTANRTNRAAVRSGTRADVLTALAGLALFALAAVVGAALMAGGDGVHPLLLDWPPLLARWSPHTGPGTAAAALVGFAVVVYGPAPAARLGWRALLAAVWAASLAWLWSLALIDGWDRGVAGQLTTGSEYLSDGLGRWQDVGAALRTFTDYIPFDSAPDNWPVHIAGHPPGMMLTLVALDRIGLGGGLWAVVFVLTAAGSAAVAVLVALRALGAEALARRAAPFVVLAPWAVWAGVSADGYFAAAGAWALALLALAAGRAVRWPWLAGLGAGLLLGWCLYLSYGLALLALPALGVLWAAGTLRPVGWVLAGAAVVVAGFTAGGFWWVEGYRVLHERYYAGAAGYRPYGYFVWANLACVVASAGLASLAGVRRAVVAVVRAGAGGLRRPPDAVVAVVLSAVLAILVADLSGMSKAETERIWLPFTLWLLPACALLPRAGSRWWLAVQGVVAFTVNSLWITGW